MARPDNRLVTIAFSHFNEKARWALDYCGVDYVERKFMPGFSHFGVMLATGGRGGKADAVSSRWSTPILVTRDGERLCDSTEIAHWASARAGGGSPGPLFPTAEVDELVAHFGRVIGPSTRVVAYWHALRSKTAFRTLAENNVSRRQALAFRAFAPLGGLLIKRGLGIDEGRKERAIERVKKEIALVEARLEGHRYLVGDGFTAADLTFASLFSPALLVTPAEGYGAAYPTVDELSSEAKDLVAEMRATKAGKFALEMFRLHRHDRYRPTSPSR
jgi:glutathione S-transferase